MRVGQIVRTVVVLAALVASAASAAQAQTASPAVNVSAVARGGVVVVSYDLIANNPTAQFSIVLEASSDGGKTYSLRPRTVKGDVGPAVRAGMGKQITWEAAQDVETLEVDRYRYRVVATPVAAQAPAAAQAPTPRAPQPTQQPPFAQPSGGSGRRWGGVALMGAGATLAALGMTTMKEEVCDVHCGKSANKKMVWAGLGAAAGGVAILAFGHNDGAGTQNSAGTQILIGPRGIVVQHRLTFKGLSQTGRP
jgi:hypothetical protein